MKGIVMPAPYPEERHLCLDMLRVNWETPAGAKTHSECAILLEIWSSGGLFQTGSAIPEGSPVIIAAASGAVHAHVSRCEQDDYGFIVQIAVDSPEGWFPAAYNPAYLSACIP